MYIYIFAFNIKVNLVGETGHKLCLIHDLPYINKGMTYRGRLYEIQATGWRFFKLSKKLIIC